MASSGRKIIKDRSPLRNPLTGILIAEGPGLSRSTEKACACTKINLKIGFLKSSFFAININSIGLAAKAKELVPTKFDEGLLKYNYLSVYGLYDEHVNVH